MANSSDNTLELQIQFKAELDAAVKSREELLELRRQANAMGVSTAGLDDEISKLDKGIGTLGKRTVPEAAEQTEQFNAKGRNLAKMVRELNHVIPGLGVALKAAFSPVGAVISALVIGFGYLNNKIKEFNDQLDQMAAEAAKPLGAGVDAYKQSLDNAKIKLGEFLSALDSAGKDKDPVKNKIDRANDLVEAELEGQRKIVEALGKSEAARLRAQGASDQQIAAAEARSQAVIEQIDMAKTRTRGSSGMTSLLMESEAQAPALKADALAKRAAADEARRKLDSDLLAVGILRGQLGGGDGKVSTYLLESGHLVELEKEKDARTKRRNAALKSPDTGWVAALFNAAECSIKKPRHWLGGCAGRKRTGPRGERNRGDQSGPRAPQKTAGSN
jgi:hypothetical protein